MASPNVQKIGKYDVLEVIGRGGMGVVFKATDPLLGRLVAIKMMTGGFFDDPDLLKRFYREAQGTASLHHPNIVTVYDMGDQDGNPYLVMEFLEGQSLDSLIQSKSEIGLLEKTNYIVQVCRGLEYAHQRSIIHRDIKPGNIMVLADGSVKIVDFGIARMGNDRVTKPGQVMGSVHYMSPEQICEREIDAGTDLFATGVVLYQLLTYELPFKGDDVASTLLKIIHDPPTPLSKYLPDCPADFEYIIDRALAKNKEDRYQSADEFAFDLLQVQAQLKQSIVSGMLQHIEPLIASGDLAVAKEQLLKALKVDPQHTRANERMREVLQEIQRRRRHEQAQQLRTRAEEKFTSSEYDEALRYVDQAISLDQTSPELQSLRSQVSDAKARADEIRTAMREAGSARKKSEFPRALLLLARVLELSPDHPPAARMRSEIEREIAERERQERVQSLLREVQEHLSSRRYSDALESLKRVQELDPGASQIARLAELASQGIERERRRAELASSISTIQGSLERKDLPVAERELNSALRKYPDEDSLLKLQPEVKSLRAAVEKQHWIEQQIAEARGVLESGNTEGALKAIESAAARYPDSPELDDELRFVRQSVEHERIERRKASVREDAAKALDSKDFEKAAALLEQAKIELATTDFDELIGKVRDEAEDDARRRKVESVVAQANSLLAQQEYDDAVKVLERAITEIPDPRLQRLLADARSRAEAQRSMVANEVAKAQTLIDDEQPDQAIAILQRHSALFGRFPELSRELENARRKSTWLSEIESANKNVVAEISAGDLGSAEAGLNANRRRFGSRREFDDVERQITARRAAMHAATVSQALLTAKKFSDSQSYSAAVETLQSAIDSRPFLSPDQQRDFDVALRSAKDGVERKRAEAERQAKLQEERRQAEERARLEEEHRRKLAAEQERARREAEQRERARADAEQKERERQQAILRAAKEDAMREAQVRARERELAEKRKNEQSSHDAPARIGPESSDRDTTTNVDRTQWPVLRDLPTRHPGSAPLAKHDKQESSVSELTPPEGLTVSPTGELSRTPYVANVQSTDARQTGKVETPGDEITPEALPSELTARPRRTSPHMTLFILMAVAVAAVSVAIGFWLRAPRPEIAVTFTTSPAGARVRVGNNACTTPCTLPVRPGVHSVQTQLEGYTPSVREFAVRSDTTAPVAITLQPLNAPLSAGNSPVASQTQPSSNALPESSPPVPTGTLVVHSNVDGATVLVDRQNEGTISGGVLRVPLEPKAYNVAIERDGFKNERARRIVVRKGRETDLAFELIPKSPVSPTTTQPPPANAANAPSNGTSATLNAPSQLSAPPPAPVSPQPNVPEDAQVWARISNSNNRSDFQEFQNRFPSSSHAQQVAAKLSQLDWEAARQKNSPDALQAYLTKYPSGPYSDQARRDLQKLQTELLHNSDRQAIISVLKRFEASYNDRDADKLASIWPTLPKKELNKYRDSFKAAQSVHMRLDPGEPKINGDVATVKCGRFLQFVFKQDVQPARQDEVTFELRKTGGNWVVESAR